MMGAGSQTRWSQAAALAILTCAAVSRAADPADAFYLQREVTVGQQTHEVALHVPADYDASRPWPLVVFLHGSGECGTDGLKQTRVGLGPHLEAHPEQWPCLVLMPQKPAEKQEWEDRETLVLAAIADVQQAYNIDPDRIALTGISQGGHGVWMIAARHPGLFSCLAPVCGYGRARSIARHVAELPVWAFHGLRDDVVRPSQTRRIIDEIRRLKRGRGSDPESARLTLYPEANHNSWDPAYSEPELPGWLLGQVRGSRPGR